VAVLGQKEDKTLRLRERRYVVERLMREKRSEQMDVLEEVFDKPTLMIIYQMLNRRELLKVCGVVRSGKESRIYWAKDFKNKDVALKVFLTTSSEFRKGMLTYIEGDPRFFRHKRDTRSLIYLWAQKEFKNLQLAASVGVRVPKPRKVEKNVLVMEFIGEKGEPAPLLRETKLKAPSRTYKEILSSVTKLYRKARLVHGDLSEYNIMIWKYTPVIFDLSQSVPLEHPMAEFFLKRDIVNITTYFAGFGVNVVPLTEAYNRMVSRIE
jgi:RIO kinase 1